ncbi:hypothetical protein NFI96_022673 [Prochilodus magdalenae]|nr:hypothetical protein NFI96_022673 [Prochilodus magdalenae]
MAFVAPPGYQPIYNPSIPYVGPIYGGLRAGMSLYIQGKIHHHINRFHVNLQCGEFEGCDIAFHLNPRFDFWDKVVFNTFQNGSWEGEEKVTHMPFHKGEHFELVIVVNTEGYQISINGKDFYLFQHRMPLERVCALEIGGDVSIDTINIIGGMQGGMGGMGVSAVMFGFAFRQILRVNHQGAQLDQNQLIFIPNTGGGYPGGMGGGMGGGYQGGGMGGMGGGYPGPGMGLILISLCKGGGMGYPGGNLPVMGLQPIFNPIPVFRQHITISFRTTECRQGIPYSDMIPGGMTFKRTIIIRGMVPYGADRFCINFMVGGSRDIAFHLNPRIREGVLVRNSLIDGCWGDEETEFGFNPFMEGQFFEVRVHLHGYVCILSIQHFLSRYQISIRCSQEKFKVYANGQHLCTFFHRIPYEQISMLEVEGDVQLSYIHY